MSRIKTALIVSVRAPIISGNYQVKDQTIHVSYEKQFDFGAGPIDIPKSICTVFRMEWEDDSEKTTKKLKSKKPERIHPLYDILEYINELFIAYKLVRIGHIAGAGIRTIGINDVIQSWIWVDDKIVDSRNTLRIQPQDYPNLISNAKHHEDVHGTTELAKPHIGTNTLHLTRRFVRCFELIEHGYYTESLLVAFSILDDQIQEMIHTLLKAKGLKTEKEQKQFTRAIKENRLENYLGPVLIILGGKSLIEFWPESKEAIKWLNGQRNKVAHTGSRVTHSVSKIALYTCLKTLYSLKKEGFFEFDIPVEIYRDAKIKAAWSEEPPNWIPKGQEAGTYEYN